MLKRITIEDNEEYLRQISSDVDIVNDNYNEYIKHLREFCINNAVYALAPIQIGIPKRIIYIRNTSSDMNKNTDSEYNEEVIYINPIIKKVYGHTQFLEGCASCMYSNGNYVTGVVDRPYKIDIEYLDIDGNKQDKTIEGFETIIFCHEYDHLNGILHMDRIKEQYLMTLDDMKKYRLENPYKIISKEDTIDELNNYKCLTKNSVL